MNHPSERLTALRTTALRAAMVTALGAMSSNALAASNFTMLDPSGGIVGGTNDVAATWDGTFNTSASSTNFNMTLSSTYPFFGYVWTAHHIRVFEPGTYTINTECTTGSSSPADLDAGTCTPNADPAKNYTLTVGAGQIGAHMLFDWNVSSNIDVLQVWDVAAVFGPSPMYTGAGRAPGVGCRRRVRPEPDVHRRCRWKRCWHEVGFDVARHRRRRRQRSSHDRRTVRRV